MSSTGSGQNEETRGSHDHRLDRTSKMLAVRWNDNSVVSMLSMYVVSMLSNCFSVEPMLKVERWSAAEKKNVETAQPYLILQYNRYVGGTDRMDQNIAKLRVNIRIKK